MGVEQKAKSKTVLDQANWQGSGTKNCSIPKIPILGEVRVWNEAQKKDINKRASEATKIKNPRNKTINKISYCL